jgi:hypothetical protein
MKITDRRNKHAGPGIRRATGASPGMYLMALRERRRLEGAHRGLEPVAKELAARLARLKGWSEQ